MPVFFILPLWFGALVLAVVSLFFKRYRFLALHLALCSTGGLVGSTVFVALAFMGIAKFENQTSNAWAIAFLFALAVAALVGVCVGLAAGFFTARWLNRQMGWQHPDGIPS